MIDSARLLDAQAFKGAIGAGPAYLGIVVTEDFYQYVVRNSEDVTNPAGYTETNVHVKEASLRARMTLGLPSVSGPPAPGGLGGPLTRTDF